MDNNTLFGTVLNSDICCCYMTVMRYPITHQRTDQSDPSECTGVSPPPSRLWVLVSVLVPYPLSEGGELLSLSYLEESTYVLYIFSLVCFFPTRIVQSLVCVNILVLSV